MNTSKIKRRFLCKNKKAVEFLLRNSTAFFVCKEQKVCKITKKGLLYKHRFVVYAEKQIKGEGDIEYGCFQRKGN